jgi:hypothetical protein
MDRILNWAPQEDFAVRLSDKSALPRTRQQLEEMCEKINAIANEYDFNLSCFGGWTGLRMIAIKEDELFKEFNSKISNIDIPSDINKMINDNFEKLI